MQVVIAGGHGKIGLRLAALLAGRGDVVTGVVRNPDHVGDLEGAGATAAVLDLESAGARELAATLTGADAVVFAAGAGPGSGVARKDTVDRAAAELLAEAARLAGVRRYLLVSSAGVDDPPAPERGSGGRRPAEPAGRVDGVWAAYLAAKRAAEDAIRAADHLDWTILRPGSLTDDPGVGRVQLAPPPVPHGSVTRDDTAAVLAALLDAPSSAGRVLELREGDTDVLEAVAAVA
ncbi:MAG TPA: NAD(P)H-binding protein [Pseudonocardia sp.]|nr:NAD(P)H-binding protein [Pseudonocardia sp.]